MNLINKLYEAVYYGADLEFKYKNKYYFINSGTKEDGVHIITVMCSVESFYGDNIGVECDEIYNAENRSATENTNQLFNSKLFEEHNLYEIEADITEINY